MPHTYIMNVACNDRAIREQEYATSRDLMITTGLDSCIGVAVRVDSSFTLAHLVFWGHYVPPLPSSAFPVFREENAQTVFNYLDILRIKEGKDQFSEVLIFGNIDDWKMNQSSDTIAGYAKLVELLQSKVDPAKFTETDTGKGTYAVQINSDGNLIQSKI